MIIKHCSYAVIFFSSLVNCNHQDKVNLFSSSQPEISEIILNPTHETIYYVENGTLAAAGDELVYAAADPLYIESLLSFDLSYTPFDAAELENSLSSCILKVYSLSGGVDAVIFDIDGSYDSLEDAISIDDSRCAESSPCWIEVDLTDDLLWSIDQNHHTSQIDVRISTDEQSQNGAFAASSYKGGIFAPRLILEFRSQALDPADLTRKVNLKGSNPAPELDKKEKKKLKKMANNKNPGKKANNKNPGKKTNNKKDKKKKKPNKKKPGKKDKPGKKKPNKKDKPGKKDKPNRPGGKGKPLGNKGPKPSNNIGSKPKPEPSNNGSRPKPKPSNNVGSSMSNPKPPKPTGPTASPPTAAGTKTLKILESKKSTLTEQILMYDDPSQGKIPSVYTFDGLMSGLSLMSSKGVAGKTFYLGNDGPNGSLYGLVNVAAFLAQSMKETIKYNACDENSWDLVDGKYPLANACGQLGQSYQDYHCPAHEKHMECPVDPKMEITAVTHATWYGAPGPLYCKPKSSNNDFTGFWDYQFECNNPWADPPLKCEVYEGQKAGQYDNSIKVANTAGRTDVEGCCWWGRGVIQTTGICNFGKLNYYLGARAAKEGRNSPYPDIDFCKDPEVICSSQQHKELKWIAGMFYWMESLQTYDSKGWNYIEQLHAFVDGGLSDPSFINAVSGIVNRGCHDPPCGTGEVDGVQERSGYFSTVMSILNS